MMKHLFVILIFLSVSPLLFSQPKRVMIQEPMGNAPTLINEQIKNRMTSLLVETGEYVVMESPSLRFSLDTASVGKAPRADCMLVVRVEQHPTGMLYISVRLMEMESMSILGSSQQICDSDSKAIAQASMDAIKEIVKQSKKNDNKD